LGKLIKARSKAIEKLEKEEVVSEEKRRLERQIKEGEGAINTLMKSYIPFVVECAKTYSGKGVPLLDLIQEGNLGLRRAAEKFDYELGEFKNYAFYWIRQAMQRAVSNLPDEELYLEDLNIEEQKNQKIKLEDEDVIDPEEEVRKGEIVTIIRRKLDHFGSEQRKVLELRYGFKGKEHSYREIAEKLEINQEKVEKILKDALYQLRAAEGARQLRALL
jgi:RNA polymerase sigma factor (sigma-70 family)